MANIGSLVWKIEGDTKKIDKSLKSTETKMDKFGKMAKAAFSVAALVLFAKKAFDVGKALIGAASDAEETANKFNVVFDGITRAGEAADNLAESYGLSHEASQNLLASTSDLLQGFGVAKDESLDLSEQVQMLAADLSSFTNNEGGAEAASKALTSAMLGEREAVKSLGIAITDAELKLFAEETGQVYNEMNKAEKAVLTLNLAISQSANAIGDFSRSQSSFANQSKIARANVADLQAIMGDKLLPAATKLVTKFNDMVGELVDFHTAVINLEDAFKGEATANYNDALDKQREIIRDLTIAVNEGGVAAKKYELLTGVLIRNQEAQLVIEIQRLEILGRIASNRLRASGELANEAEKLKLANEEEEKRLRLLKEEEERLKLIEELRLSAVAALELNTARTAELFEEKAQAERDAMADRANASAELLYAERIAEEERHEQRIANLQAELQAASQFAGSLSTIFTNLVQIQMSGDDELSEKKKRNIIALYRMQQAANVAQIAMDTRAAVMRQYKDLPIWLAVLSKIAVIGIGLTSIAAVMSTPPPVALAEGGVFPARPGGTNVILGEGGLDEKVEVTPLDEGAGQLTLTVIIHDEALIGPMQVNLDSRNVIVDAGSIGGL